MGEEARSQKDNKCTIGRGTWGQLVDSATMVAKRPAVGVSEQVSRRAGRAKESQAAPSPGGSNEWRTGGVGVFQP